jgi:hypothetical protein
MAKREDTLGKGLIATTLILMIGLALWLAQTVPQLPDLLPLHFDAQGNPDRIADREELWLLAGIALGVNLLNLPIGLLARLRFGMVFASYLLWGGAVMVQILLWIAAWNIVY